MQTQVAPSVRGARIDGRALAAAGMCVLALFGASCASYRSGAGRGPTADPGTLKDCVGIYELVDPNARPSSTLEFWVENERLAGRETITDSQRRHVRVLRGIKLDETGETEFQPASYLEASQQKAENTTTISFSWSPQTETGKFIPGGFQTGVQKYRKQCVRPAAG